MEGRRINRRYTVFLAAFLQRLYSCELPIYTPPMGHFATLDTRQYPYTHTIVKSHLELHHSHTCAFNQSRSKIKDLSREKLVCIRSWWSVLAQVKALACYSWWLASPRRSWWSRCFSRSLPRIVGARRRRLYVAWSPPRRDGERRLLVSALVSVTWEVTILFVSVTTWIRGVCQHIDTTGKNPVVSCPLSLFKHFLSCNLLMCLT